MKIGQPHRPVEIMPSKMEVASQHCDTVQNKTKDILDTVKKDFLYMIVGRGIPCRVVFVTVETVEINRKV